MPIADHTTVTMAAKELTFGDTIVELRDANDIQHDVEALRARLDEDGYLLLRDFHPRQTVLDARRELLEKFAAKGVLDVDAPLMDARIGPDNRGLGYYSGDDQPEVREGGKLIEALESPPLMSFFDRYFGEKSVTYDFKWVRATCRGGNTPAHYDIVYMGRGTQQVVTCWTPFGDIPLAQGPLCLLLGSHRCENVKETYGAIDVDTDPFPGALGSDAHELASVFGGTWGTTEFQCGDILLFTMFTLHGSLDNLTDTYRITTDTRFQAASQPVDERWMGEIPIAHSQQTPDERCSIAEAREIWGF